MGTVLLNFQEDIISGAQQPSVGACQSARRSTTAALIPPKPNELDTAIPATLAMVRILGAWSRSHAGRSWTESLPPVLCFTDNVLLKVQ